MEAAEKTCVDANNIIRCAKKGRITAGGYVWRYAGDGYDGSYAQLPRFQKVIMYSLKGKQLRMFANATKAAVATGVGKYNIRFALKGETKTAGGFIWRFADKPYKGEYGIVQPHGRKAVGITNSKGKIINKFPSLSAASKQTGISVSGIWDRLNKKKKNNENHTWKYL
jgi:NUMOD1 domain